MNNDISKCPGIIEGEPCLNKERCLRFTIKSDNLWQAWLTPSYGKPGVCRDFINNHKDEKKRETR